jgi:hypothetical protein
MKTPTLEQLKHKHDTCQGNEDAWNFHGAVYDGIKAMIAAKVLQQNGRESNDNYDERKKEAFTFGYCKAIVNLFNYYLHEKPAKNNYDALGQDPLFQMFEEDADLYGTAWDEFLKNQQKNASIWGVVGILIDSASGAKTDTKAQNLESKIYPYAAAYSPQNILDWEYKRNPVTNRPELTMLKLYEEDKTYLIWTKDEWGRFRIGDKEAPVFDSGGTNAIGEIPFVWFYNMKHRQTRNLGISDLATIGYIEASMVRNLSQGEEVIKYAAFPMQLRPKKEINAETGQPDTNDDTVGPRAILEFDPQYPESKPAWLNSETLDPIKAIELWIDRKIREIYRTTYTGSAAQAEIQKTVKSGEALKREFQMLNSVLSSKAKNEVNAEQRALYYWCKWTGMEKEYKKVQIDREKDYSLTELATALDDAMTSITVVKAKTFATAIRKQLVREIMPELPVKTLEVIDKEIEAVQDIPIPAREEEPQPGGSKTLKVVK